MYEEHFGLAPRPFGGPAGPAGVVPLPSREATLRRLRYGLEQGQGPALLFGPPGAGKTLLALTLASELERAEAAGEAASPPAPSPLAGERWGAGESVPDRPWGSRAVHLTFPAMPAADLMAYLADDLAPGTRRPDGPRTLAGSVRRVREALSASASRGERPLLIVDEAHLIEDSETFEALRLLLNFANRGRPDLSLLLVGGPELLLHLPPGLADRMTARCLLGPLTAAESAAYVLGRLRLAGARAPLFDRQGLLDLHRLAGGLPRHLDRLADLALLIAYAEGLDHPGPAEIHAAARDPAFEDLAA